MSTMTSLDLWMNLNPPATPFQVPAFGGPPDGHQSGTDFLAFLRKLIANDLDKSTLPSTEADVWLALVEGFSTTCLATFPPANDLTWGAIEEKSSLIELCLEIIFRITAKLDGIFVGATNLATDLIIRLVNIAIVLDGWIDKGANHSEGALAPQGLQAKICDVCTAILRSLGHTVVPLAPSSESTWRTLNRVFLGGIGTVKELAVRVNSLTFPVSVNLLADPHLETHVDDVFISDPQSTYTITLTSALEVLVLMSIFVKIVVQALCPPMRSQWFLEDAIRQVIVVHNIVFEFCASPACESSIRKRARALLRVVDGAAMLYTSRGELDGILESLPHRFISLRLREGGRPELNLLDVNLTERLRTWEWLHPQDKDVLSILEVLKTEEWGEDGASARDLAINYLRVAVRDVNTDLLRYIHNTILQLPYISVEFSSFIDDKMRLISGSQRQIQPEMEINNPVEDDWQIRVEEVVFRILTGDDMTWMQDDEAHEGTFFATRALQDIEDKCQRLAHETDTTWAREVVEHFIQFPCLLARCDDHECGHKRQEPRFKFFPAYIFLAKHLLGDADAPPAARRACFQALKRALSHQDSLSESDHTKILDLILEGLRAEVRSTRLSAGKALVPLILCHTSQCHQRLEDSTFSQLYQFLDQAPMFTKETLVVCIGTLGKTKNTEVLGRVICLLVVQLGRRNTLIRATAYTQFLSLSQYHNKSIYSLILPYLDHVAPFLVSRIGSQPTILAEFCRFIGVPLSDFIATTLSRILPPLFAQGEIQTLDLIAKDQATSPSALLLKHSHEILAHVFLQDGPTQTNQSLKFIIKVLTDATQGATIDIQNVVRSCIIPLLGQLVVHLGDEDVRMVQRARDALLKVQKILSPSSGKGRNHQHIDDLSGFLKTYMLGSISVINDMLQDVQGKKTVAMKRKIIRSLGALVSTIGPAVSNVAPQVMATFQTMIGVAELAEVTLGSWHTFLLTLGPAEVGPHVGPTSAAFVSVWFTFSQLAREWAKKCLELIILNLGEQIGRHMDDVVDLSSVDELGYLHFHLQAIRGTQDPKNRLQRVLERSSSDNITVAIQSMGELKAFLSGDHQDLIQELASGDVFDPLIGKILAAIYSAACRDGDGTEPLRLLAYECVGILGAVDPDRCEVAVDDHRMIVTNNFTDEGESVLFALHLISDLLIGAFRSTSDINYQGHLAYSIQELLQFCQFTPALVLTSGASVPTKVRNRWNSLPKHVLETVTPLLESRFTLNASTVPKTKHPIYTHQSTYRDWIQLWASHLITKVSSSTAHKIFGVFRSAVRHKDVVVAHHLLPHLVLHILTSGHDDDAQAIRTEILAVLEDQVNPETNATPDKRLLSAQAVFMLLDHLNKWLRQVRQNVNTKKTETKRTRINQGLTLIEEHLLRVESILSSIDQRLMGQAALQCKAYARSLMSFEQQILSIRGRLQNNKDLHEYYERLHEIYAHLDEPDGMEGVSTLILSPSLEHQIRQHESTGRWTSAQSCWEVRLQQSPDNVEFHLGLLRCLRNLGHYDTLRTHVRGVLTQHPEWEDALSDFQVESAWMVGAWNDVQQLVEHKKKHTPQLVIGRLLLAMKNGEPGAIKDTLSAARLALGAPISAAGPQGYRRSYEAAIDLHLTHELLVIGHSMSNTNIPQENSGQRRLDEMVQLTKMLSARLESTTPTFRMREPILSMRRTAFGLGAGLKRIASTEIARSWLASAKIARKANQWQTAYSAMLQAQQNGSRYTFIQSAKLVKATGEPLRALQELENSMHYLGLMDNVLDLTENEVETKKLKAKAWILRARWMAESERFDRKLLYDTFKAASTVQQDWESGHFYLGQFHDECYKDLSQVDKAKRGLRMNFFTVKAYAKAIKFGSKYVYQTVPRLLTIWLDSGEDNHPSKNSGNMEFFEKLNDVVSRAIQEVPVYKWYTAFPQIVSRVGHSNPEVYNHLKRLIVTVLEHYPKQALWLFTAVIKSTKINREQRGKEILDKLRNSPRNVRTRLPKLVSDSLNMTNELLALCDHPLSESKTSLSMHKDFPKLAQLGKSDLLIPLQESLTASLPPTPLTESTHEPFPADSPTFEYFFEEIDIMKSLAKPRKISIRGSNGQIYTFLGKPKDDLRKDARLMDFNAIINKLLKANFESRRRQLRVRTYGVVTLNEECGFIQWVPNTIPIRPVLLKAYESRNVRSWTPEMSEWFKQIKTLKDQDAGNIFVGKVLPVFPPVFHEWFIETFPEPTAWLTSRLTYGRTAAVMSMVGFILGLGDRHCENILLDTNTGDVVHVDFNCLFEKGKTLETPERVPFRLTQNIVDGLGVTGVEGVYRIACEVTLQLLRDNKDSLMNVLDAFIHDPLVEWEDEKRRMEREPSRRNQVKASVDLRNLAKGALNSIEKKLNGLYTTSKERSERQEKAVSTSNLVQMLIQEATDPANLGKMYPGWAPWH